MNEVRRSASQLLRSYSFLLPAALAGEDDVEAAGIHYVPRLESQNDAEFAARFQLRLTARRLKPERRHFVLHPSRIDG